MTTPEMSQSTTSESTVASKPIAVGVVGSATVGHTTMSTSSTSHLTTSLPPASTTAAEMPAKASTQSSTVNTPAVAEVAGVVTRETVSTHSTLTQTPSMTQQTELTPTTIPSTATAFTRTARETTWSSMMRGDSSVPSGSTLPATPHSTNPKLTEAAGNVAETAKLSTSASTPGVKGAAGTLPTDRSTATETASPDAQKMTVGRQIRSASTTPTISTTDVSLSTPGSKEPESSQITTSTQTKSGATTAAHHLATQTDKHLLTPASLPSHGSSPAEIGLPNTVSPAPLARTTVSQQTTQAAGPAAGLWEDGHTTKEGHHGTLITTPMSVKNTPPEGSSVGTNRLSTATPTIRGAAGRPVEGPQISSSSIPHGTSGKNTITTSTTKQPEAQTTSTLRSVGTSPRETTAHPVQTPVVSSMATESKALAKNKVIASVAGIFEAGAPSTESPSNSPTVATTIKPPHASSVTRRRPRLDDVDDHDDDDKDDYDDDVNEPDDDDYRPTTSLLWASVFD
nr:unnamed protein product [Spirometra erinaceieuropaei]